MVNNEENVCVWQQELKCLVLIDLMTNLLSDDIYIEVPCNCVYTIFIILTMKRHIAIRVDKADCSPHWFKCS